ncbi:MAG: SDR family oxidoreductase [Pseudomonadota bacterium]
MVDFNGLHIVITGAASGLGRLMTERLLRAGATVHAVDVNADGLQELQASIEADARGRVLPYACDLSNRRSIAATADQIQHACPAVDILINNAGIVSGRPLLEISDEQIERTFAVNTLALFWLTRAFLPAMVRRDAGHIVTIASAGGLVGTARLTDYCASKFAAVGFDDSLRLELKRLNSRIRTTVVCPFYINTGMFAGVHTRFPWLLPILEPDYVVDRTLDAIRRGRRRLIMPRFVLSVFLARLLPTEWFDAVMSFFGISKSMDDFVGRRGREG